MLHRCLLVLGLAAVGCASADGAGRAESAAAAAKTTVVSLVEARRLGYHAMQYNFVVSTNTAAVDLWKKLGFEVVGRLPQAFRHPRLGLVDALLMYRLL